MPGKIYPITSLPGVQRDGTRFASRNYTDAQWCRFQDGVPRKMGGYKQLIGTLPSSPTGIYAVPNGDIINLYIGDASSLKYLPIDQYGNVLGDLVDRTPEGFVADANNVWTFGMIYSTISNTALLVAHAAPNLSSINSQVATPVYYGNAYTNDRLTPNGQAVSGGIAVFDPYLFMFGNSGEVIISNINDPTTVNLTARVTGKKIVAGMPARAGNSAPGGLLWSLDSLIRVTTVNTSTGLEFKFDKISNESSILSSRSIVEYDGIYFWAGIDRFLAYTGTIEEVPNKMNQNFFYYNNGTTGLNYPYRQKVWATKIPQYGEIWWFFPSGTNTECSHAIIYNKREKTLYDTEISRGAGYCEQVFADPVWSDSYPGPGGTYRLWHHESGVDQNVDGTLTAIDSYFDTGDVSWAAFDPGARWTGGDRWIYLDRIEPDFIQTGEMSVTVKTRDYARADVVESEPYTFDADTKKIDMREQGREMILRFQSDAIGGFYQLGQTLLDYRIGDGRASR
jgi:hypothetical protein